MQDNILGHVFWASIFSYGVIFPMTLARKISTLRYFSLFSFFCGTYVVLVIVFTCLFNHKINPNLRESIQTAATQVKLSAKGIFNSFPLIVFAFLYHPNLPTVYQELSTKNLTNMWKVIIIATLIAVVCYVIAGFFGFATFATYFDVD